MRALETGTYNLYDSSLRQASCSNGSARRPRPRSHKLGLLENRHLWLHTTVTLILYPLNTKAHWYDDQKHTHPVQPRAEAGTKACSELMEIQDRRPLISSHPDKINLEQA